MSVGKKRSPYRLLVDDTRNDDNSVVLLSPGKMEELQFFRGDTVLIKGKKNKDSVCIVLADVDTDTTSIRMNKVRAIVFDIIRCYADVLKRSRLLERIFGYV